MARRRLILALPFVAIVLLLAISFQLSYQLYRLSAAVVCNDRVYSVMIAEGLRSEHLLAQQAFSGLVYLMGFVSALVVSMLLVYAISKGRPQKAKDKQNGGTDTVVE